MSDIQRDYERRYHSMNSRWLAYCYAVDRHPTSSPAELIPGVELPVIWIATRMDQARADLGLGSKLRLTEGEAARCNDLLWRYAVEERA